MNVDYQYSKEDIRLMLRNKHESYLGIQNALVGFIHQNADQRVMRQLNLADGDLTTAEITTHWNQSIVSDCEWAKRMMAEEVTS